MLASDENSGLFTFLVGLIVVVFAGVALSLMVDRKFSFSERANSLESTVKNGAAELADLNENHRACSLKLSELEPRRRNAAGSRDAMRSQLADLGRKRATLVTARDALLKSIPALEQEFAGYRGKYRESARAAAVGQSLGTLAVRGGREYQKAVISSVTDVGLEIRHEHGIARIQAPDLDQALQDRFQWNDEERRARLVEENAAREAIVVAPEVTEPERSAPVRPSARDSGNDGPDPEKVAALRARVIQWKSRVSQLSADRSRALSSASYGSQSSVPGSLETWQAKASRLGNELSKASAELAAARAALGMLAPGDPLLRPERELP